MIFIFLTYKYPQYLSRILFFLSHSLMIYDSFKVLFIKLFFHTKQSFRYDIFKSNNIIIWKIVKYFGSMI